MRIRRPSHATVVAYLALFVALAGSAYAVSKVGTRDLKKSAVTSAKIRDHAVGASDLRQLVLRERVRNVASGNTAMSDVSAKCKQNERLIGGAGGWITNGDVASATAFARPSGRPTQTFQVRGTNPDGSSDTLLAQAICLRK
jgi:hypothetical protein